MLIGTWKTMYKFCIACVLPVISLLIIHTQDLALNTYQGFPSLFNSGEMNKYYLFYVSI
jgi:hypothetical protein